MRITNSMVSHSLIKNLNANLQKMNKYQTQLLMNTKITKLSDDPVGAAISLQTRSSLQRTEQYKKNAEDARTLLAFTRFLSTYKKCRSILLRHSTVGGPSGTRTPDRPVMSRLL
jgi:flagellar hook-associated protein 3 FlgL